MLRKCDLHHRDCVVLCYVLYYFIISVKNTISAKISCTLIKNKHFTYCDLAVGYYTRFEHRLNWMIPEILLLENNETFNSRFIFGKVYLDIQIVQGKIAPSLVWFFYSLNHNIYLTTFEIIVYNINKLKIFI